MPIFHDRAQETSSNTPASSGAISITLNGATTYNRTFAGAGYVNADAVLVHVWQTSNPALWCVVPGQFVDTPDRITFTDTDIEDGSSGAGVSPTWTGTVTVGVEMVASIADAAVNAVTDHGALTGLADDDHTQYHTDARGDARYSPLGHNHAGVYDPAGTAASAVTAHDTASAHAGIVAAQTTAATSKATPVDADEIPLADSADSFGLKKLTWANLKTTLGSTFAALGNWVEEAANVVARRNGANVQSLRLYNTYTDASNYERLTLTGTAGSNVELKAESAGTGAANLDVRISTKGTGRFFAGLDAGRVSTGAGVLAVGPSAGYNNTTGGYWTALGYSAGYSSTTGTHWTALGNSAGYSNTTGNFWTAIGQSSGRSNTTGSYWTALGQYAGYSNTTGNSWTAVGQQAGFHNTTGSYWTAVGQYAGRSNTTGSSWTAVGQNAGYDNTTGSYWTALGQNAARYLADGATGAGSFYNSTYIGTNTKVSANGVTNENVFGYNAVGSGSNTVTIGNSSVTGNYFSGLIDATGDKLRLRTAKTPSSAADTGNQGDICWDSSYIYVCTAANTWKRAALTTW